MIDLKKVLVRIEVETLIKLLPYWQKAYFLNLSNSLSSEEIAEFFLNNKQELLTQKVTSVIFNYFNSDELTKLSMITKRHKLELFSFRRDLVTDNVDKKKFNKILQETFESNEEPELYEHKNKTNTIFGPDKRFFELLDYQVYVKEQLMTVLNENKDRNRALVHMPTGTGKTKTTMHTLVEYFLNTCNSKGLIIWIAHTNTLLEQAEETFETVWNAIGHNTINIHRLYDNNNSDIEDVSNGMVFMGVSKLISLSKENISLFEEIASKVNLIIFDEAHKVTASETSVAVKKLFKYVEGKKKRLIGLTATPGRHNDNDTANENLADFFDRNIISINPLIIEQLRVSMFKAINQELSHLDLISYLQKREILSILIRENIEYKNDDLESELSLIRKKISSGDYSSDVIRVVSRDFNRNISIISRLVDLAKQGRQIIFFACGVDHGKFITSILRFHRIRADEVYGVTNSKERIDTIRKFRKIGRASCRERV